MNKYPEAHNFKKDGRELKINKDLLPPSFRTNINTLGNVSANTGNEIQYRKNW